MFGVIDVGGGLKSIYGAGVFDWCMKNNIHFDRCIGVSAGAANIVSYVGNQFKRNYVFYTEYTQRKEYMSFHDFVHTGSYLDLDYIYGTLSNSGGENPLDFDSLSASNSAITIVATNALTGKPHYFSKNDLKKDSYGVLMATCAIPVVCRPQYYNKVPYYDGGISDPIPVKRAVAEGCDKIVLILSRPKDVIRTPKKDRLPSKILKRKFPEAGKDLLLRTQIYNEGVALAKKYEKNGRLLIIAPDDLNGIETLTKDPVKLKWLYEKGFNDAKKIKIFLNI